MKVKLQPRLIEEIETALAAGYDIELRNTRYGVTAASLSKKLIYKESDDYLRTVREQNGINE